MAVLTATDYANQIVAQVRVLNPSFSGEIGTPERKIIDAVAQSLAENQVDLTGLAGALDIDSKYGTNLDRFTALFGFQRQASVAATGFVVFSTTSAALQTINIPANVILQSNTPTNQGQYMQYTTQAGGQIAVGQTQSQAVPIMCTVTGSSGNAAANVITQMVGTIPGGVTSVTNPNALTNGLDQETDAVFKTRFKNTWARNLSGTESQYLAIAVSSAYTTMANAIGSQSRYQEYIQVPDYDDAGYVGGTEATVPGTSHLTGTGGVQNQWTSALSDIPYVKQVYSTTAAFIQDTTDSFFYRPDMDFQFNPTPLVAGDVLRDQPVAYQSAGATLAVGTDTITADADILDFPSAGSIYLLDSSGNLQGPFAYTGISGTQFTGVNITKSVTVVANAPIYLSPAASVAPNFTFLNVNTSSTTGVAGLQALAPGDIVLSEYSYVSSSSRNDLDHGVTNAVDVYVNGANDVASSCIFLGGNAGGSMMATANPSMPFYYENYRRYGSLTQRPNLGNYITPLFNTPLDALPETITINNQNYYLGTHYWLVQDVGPNGGSIRARDGIEWSATIPGDASSIGAPTNDYSNVPAYTGTTFASLATGTPITVSNYLYDANIVTLQANLENARQMTTDVLAHRATMRYFQLDVTVMYAPTANPSVTNAAISTAISAFFARQPFGAVIQLSDLLSTISGITGVDNVRWSNDLPIVPDAIRVLETDINGNPLHGAHVVRLTPGVVGSTETQTLYIAGGYKDNPNLPYVAFGVNDTFVLDWAANGGTGTTTPIKFSTLTAATLQSAIRTATGSSTITVTQDTRPSTDVSNPLTSFTIQYTSTTGNNVVPAVTNNITSSAFAYDGDFFLLDNQLPAIPSANLTANQPAGVTVRVRAQNTWLRPGLS